jgi:hypothetical protein
LFACERRSKADRDPALSDELQKLQIMLKRSFFLNLFLLCITSSLATAQYQFDVVVYGATPAGVAAAVNAARQGVSVALLEETSHVGGLASSGLSNTDFHSFESLGGTWLEFMNRVESHYVKTYGPQSQQVKDCWQGAFYEPKVAEQVFMQMLEEQDRLSLFLNHRLVSASSKLIKESETKLSAVRLKDLEQGRLKDVEAQVFIDATYEGDLLAAAGCEYIVGSEGPEKYDEAAASAPDWHVQCYNFRVTLSKDPDNSIPVPKPDNYDPEDFQWLIAEMEAGNIDDLEDIIKGPSRQIPNNKADFNDRKGSKMSIKICNQTDVWPEGNTKVRQQVWEEAKAHTLGVFYFLQHDERVLPVVQNEMKRWNLPKDEFEAYGNFPPLIYVREGRRLLGQYVFTQKDGTREEGSTRAPAFADAVAIGDYSFNSHGTYYTPDRELLGNLSAPSKPFQIPYPVMLPKEVSGLLVPVAVSSSRVGFGAIRMEPTWTALGQTAGLAAGQAVNDGVELENVDVDKLQRQLHASGAITFYTSDVNPDSPYFRAVQYLGNHGLFQDLYDPAVVPKKRIKKLDASVQWTTAYPYHDIQPEKKIDQALASKWMEKLNIENEKLLKQAGRITRGAFLQELYQLKTGQ